MKQITTYLLVSFLICYIGFAHAQPDIQWEHSLGGNNSELGYGIRQTSDKGFISVGHTSSTNGDVDGLHSAFYSDIWLVKMDTAGEIEWQKCLGGTNDEYGYDIEITHDGGYIIAGSTASDDGDVSPINGGFDCWIIKTDSSGNIEWEQTYGGIENDEAYSIEPTADGGYIFAGRSGSNNGDVTDHHGDAFFGDGWVVKIDSDGNLQWQHSLGGTVEDFMNEVINTADGGYMCVGYSDSNDGDVTGHHSFAGVSDMWLVKVDAEGNMEWQRSYGGSFADWGNAVLQTADHKYIIAGTASSDDGDITDPHGDYDYWIVKTDSTGNILWQKNYGGSQQDEATEISITFSGGYFVTGFEYSDDGDVTGNHNGADYWALKIDSTGGIIWQNTLGGGLQDFAYDGRQINDGSYILTGASNSLNGDVSDNHSFNDIWVVRLESDCAVTSANFSYMASDASYAFCDSSVNAEEWFWDFGDGSTDTINNPIHTYSESGTYTVCLTATGSCNMDSICQDITITLVPDALDVINTFQLQVFPIPLNETGTVSFMLNTNAFVSMKIIDITGRVIMNLCNPDQEFGSGRHIIHFNTEDLRSGSYIVRMVSDGETQSRALLIL